ncbi:hypothetical protein C0J52_23349 [Blattella germanica]|nr:hypothetical protein C0J52_23349 [Blattella germanica]
MAKSSEEDQGRRRAFVLLMMKVNFSLFIIIFARRMAFAVKFRALLRVTHVKLHSRPKHKNQIKQVNLLRFTSN